MAKVAAVCGGLLFAILVARNGFLFTQHLYEQGDFGANSILIEQARRFTLLTGNYSREGFHHPGPAYLYVQAAGEELFRYLLHLVPTAYNGQLLAVYLLNSALLGLIPAIIYDWTRSARGAATALAVLAVFAAIHPAALNSSWMPFLYVPAYLTFLVAAGSVAAGRTRHAWIMALSGWLLIHGHVCFLLFVPLITLSVAGYRWAPRMRRWIPGRLAGRAGQPPERNPGARGAWIAVAVTSVVFALPIVLNLIMHWPGDFGHYLSYSHSGAADGHTPAQVLRYLLWFWWPGREWLAAVIAVLLTAAACVTAWRTDKGPLRRLLGALLLVNAVSTVAFAAYIVAGVDLLSEYYIGYFYWSAPAITVLVIAVGLLQAVPLPAVTGATAAAAAAAMAVFAVLPGTTTSLAKENPPAQRSGAVTDPALAAAVTTLSAQSRGHVLVIDADRRSWSDVTGFLVQAERTGVKACVTGQAWRNLVTAQFVCTGEELADGARYNFTFGSAPDGGAVLVRLHATLVTRVLREHE